jgi:hypothetical protein
MGYLKIGRGVWKWPDLYVLINEQPLKQKLKPNFDSADLYKPSIKAYFFIAKIYFNTETGIYVYIEC